MPAKNPLSIAIVGAGITGLTAAWRLGAQGHRVRVFERDSRVGGAIRTIRESGYLIEAGPNTLQYRAPEVKELVRELGLEPELLHADTSAKKRYIARRGRFVAVPASPPELFTTRLFSLRTKLSILAELFARPRIRNSDVSLAQLVRSHFTQELVDYALNPFVAGVYAGDPEKLSARHAFPSVWQAERSHGSLIRGMAAASKTPGDGGPPPIVSFRNGLQSITDALAARIGPGNIGLDAVIDTIIPGRPNRIVWKQGSESQSGEFDAVLLAIPANALSQIRFGALGERPLAPVEAIPHPPVSSLFLGYRRDRIAHPLDGFGGLVPALERRELLGVLFSSTPFAGRAPEGHAGLTVFVGGMRQPQHARMPTDQILRLISRDLSDLVGATGEPAFVRHSYWPAAIPQYQVGHERYIESMAAVEKKNPGVLIGGNARDGISLPDCVKSGFRLAAAAAALAR